MTRITIVARVLALVLPLLAIAGATLPARAQMTGPLERAMMKMVKANSYHFDMTENNGSASIKSSGDVASLSPMKMKITMESGPEGAMQMIVLPSGAYMKVGTGAWKAMPGAEAMYQQMDVIGMMRKQAPDTAVTDLGMTSRDGVTLHGYHVANPKTSTESNVYLDGSGNLVRVEAGTMVMRFSNFGAPVSVVAPL